MTQKDYIKIAAVLAGDFAVATDPEKLALWTTTLSLAHCFAQDNPRFDYAKFYKAVFGSADHFAVRDEITNRISEKIKMRELAAHCARRSA